MLRDDWHSCTHQTLACVSNRPPVELLCTVPQFCEPVFHFPKALLFTSYELLIKHECFACAKPDPAIAVGFDALSDGRL
jgi:hypothetical protein